MTITEPVTMLTDYALGGVTGWLAWLLFRVTEAHVSRLLWAVALTALACAAVLGGTFHGFAAALGEGVLQLLWKVTVLAVGVAAFCMFAGSAVAITTGGLRRIFLGLGVAQLMLYSAWMLGHDDYLFVVADTAAAMIGIAALHARPALWQGDRASRWMLAAVGISVLAAATQASGVALHRHLNHNDLYHLVQIAAMTLFYKGARLLQDRHPS